MKTESKSLETHRARVLASLENSRFNWRSVDGIGAETGLAGEEIQQILDANPHIVVRASERDAKGRPLYTTREHYKRTHSFASRLINAVTDRVA